MLPQNPKTEPKQRKLEEASAWEKLKRNGVEVVGRVQVPEIWGQEDLLKDWIDCKAFDSMPGNKAVVSARAALVGERGRVNSDAVKNGC